MGAHDAFKAEPAKAKRLGLPTLPSMQEMQTMLRQALLGPDNEVANSAPLTGHPNVLKEVSTLASWFPYDSYDSPTGLYHNQDSIGIVLEVTPQTGADDTMEDRLRTLLNPLPPGTCGQWILFGGPMSYERLNAYVEHRQIAKDKGMSSDFFVEMAKRRAAFFLKDKGRSLWEGDNFSIRDFRLLLTITRPGTAKDRELVEDMTGLVDVLKAALASSGLPAQTMNASEFLTFMKPLTDPRLMFERTTQDFVEHDPGKPLNQQLGSIGMPVKVTSKSILWGAQADEDSELSEQIAARVFTVRSYPRNKRLWEMTNIIGALYDDTLQYPCPFVITQGFHILNRAVVEDANNMKGARAQQNADSKMAKFQMTLKDINNDYQHMQNHINNGGQQVVMYHTLTLFAPPAEMRKYESTVQNIWYNEGFKLVRCDAITSPMYVASMPMVLNDGVAKSLHSVAKVATRKTDQNAIDTAPVIAEWFGSGDPVMLFFGKRGTPTYLDFYSNKAGNYNFAVTGVSGSGKSVLMNEIINAYRSVGGIARIIDIGRSYEKLIRGQGGIFLEFPARNMPCINPFTWVGDDAENSLEDEMRYLKPMISRMAAPNTELDAFQSALIEEAITNVWREYGKETCPDLIAKYLLTIKNENGTVERRAYELSKQLFPFTRKGQYGKVVNGKATIELDGDMIGLEMEELAGVPDLQRVVLFAITSLVTHDMYLRPRTQKKLFLMDEAWQVLGKDGDTGKFIEEGYRRARKYEGIFGVGTQGIGDFFKSPAGLAAYENADWKLYGRQDPDVIEGLSRDKKINFSAPVMKMIKELRKQDNKFSEWLVSSPNGKSVVKCILDPFFITMASTKGPVYERVKALIDDGVPMIDAITQVVREQGHYV